MPATLQPNYFAKLYLTWSIISTDSCICLDLANGSKLIYGATSGCLNCSSYKYTNEKPVNNMILIVVRYPKEADYNVSVFIYNGYESVRVNQTIPVTNVKCAKPVISMIHNKYLNPYTPQKDYRSSQIIVSARIDDLPCPVTKSNFKLWSAMLVDPTKFSPIKSISLASIPTSNNTYLIIPPRFLDYGLYLLTFTVVMDKNFTVFTFQSSNDTYLRIEKSNIIVGLSSGGISLLTRGIKENICFTPKVYSQDPDLHVQVCLPIIY